MSINDDLVNIAGMTQRHALLKQQKKTNALLEKQAEETRRKQTLPKCPRCASPVERQAKVCKECNVEVCIVGPCRQFAAVNSTHPIFLKSSVVGEFIEPMKMKFIDAQETLIKKSDSRHQSLIDLSRIIYKISEPNSPASKALAENILEQNPKLPPIAKPVFVTFVISFFIISLINLALGDFGKKFLGEGVVIFLAFTLFAIVFVLPALVWKRINKKRTDIRDSRRQNLRLLHKNIQKTTGEELQAKELRGRYSVAFNPTNFNRDWSDLTNDHSLLVDLSRQFDLDFPALKKRPDFLKRIRPSSLPKALGGPKNSWDENDLSSMAFNTSCWKDFSKFILEELDCPPDTNQQSVINNQKPNGSRHDSLEEDSHSTKDKYFIKLPNNKIKGPYLKPQITGAIKNKKLPLGCSYSKLKDGPWKELPTG